jgi:hypothetical protein
MWGEWWWRRRSWARWGGEALPKGVLLSGALRDRRQAWRVLSGLEVSAGDRVLLVDLDGLWRGGSPWGAGVGYRLRPPEEAPLAQVARLVSRPGAFVAVIWWWEASAHRDLRQRGGASALAEAARAAPWVCWLGIGVGEVGWRDGWLRGARHLGPSLGPMARSGFPGGVGSASF